MTCSFWRASTTKKKSRLRAACAIAPSFSAYQSSWYAGGGFVPDEGDTRLRTRTVARISKHTDYDIDVCFAPVYYERLCYKVSSHYSRFCWSTEYIFSPSDMVPIQTCRHNLLNQTFSSFLEVSVRATFFASRTALARDIIDFLSAIPTKRAGKY